MIALAFLLGVALVASLGLNAWLTYRNARSSDREADARVGQIATESELERAAYERDIANRALEAAHRRAHSLEQLLGETLNDARMADLPVHDYSTRVRRIYAEWAGADKDRVPAEPDRAVSEDAAPAETGPAAVSPVGTLR